MGKQKEDEEKKDRTALLLQERKKIIYNLVLVGTASVVVLIGVLTMAWFAINQNAGTSGMGNRTEYNGFELRVSGDAIGFSDLYEYLDPDLTGNSGFITNNSADGQVISWRMVDGDDAVRPGSQGELDFDVVSGRTDLSGLKYSLYITSFEAETHMEATSDGSDEMILEEVVDNLNVIESPAYSGAILNAAGYLNGHVLFFTGRSGDSKDNYKYYGFIDDKEDFGLTLSNGSGTIYWIWPNTLGQIALNSTDTDYISGTPVLDSAAVSYDTDRTKLTAYLKSNASNVFSGSENYSNLIDDMYTNRDGALSYKTEFNRLSEGYNAADQTIGNYVDYILIHMIVSSH